MGHQEVHALAGVDMNFRRGEFWAIMGPSGSGKSTMLNILGCLDRVSKGRYYIENKEISQFNDDDLSEIRLRHLGFIFQSFNLIPQLSVQRNIELPLYYLGLGAASQRRARGGTGPEGGIGRTARSQAHGAFRRTDAAGRDRAGAVQRSGDPAGR